MDLVLIGVVPNSQNLSKRHIYTAPNANQSSHDCRTRMSARVTSQMKILVRRNYSSPPINGSRIVTELLSDPQLKAMWLKDVKKMADRCVSDRVNSIRSIFTIKHYQIRQYQSNV